MEEVFKDIPGYEGYYQISNFGNVKSLSRYRDVINKKYFINEFLLKIKINNNGRPCVNLSKEGKVKTFIVHKLMAIVFLNHIPNGHKIVVDHIDNNKVNNNIENLQLITARENVTKDRKNVSSKYPGVYFAKDRKKWRSAITINYNKVDLGSFENEYDAHTAYQNKLKTL